MNKNRMIISMVLIAIGAQATDVDLSPEITTVSNTENLRFLLRDSQKRLCFPSIPSSEILWDSLGKDEDIFVDWGGFKPSERKNAVAVLDRYLIPRYEVLLWESPEDGSITVANAYGETMAILKPEKEFDPLGWAYDYFGTSELTTFQQVIHASWHSALSLTLTPISFAEVCADIREEEQALAVQEALMAPMAMSFPAVVTNLVMGIDNTNGTVEVQVAWPGGFDSDTLDLFICQDLVAADWHLETNFPTVGSTNFYFQDEETNHTARFYVTGTDYDEDLDGLSSARERYIYKLREDLSDTSGDGCGDGWLLQYGFNPLALNTLGDADNDGYSNLEEQLNDTDPATAQSNSNTGTVATIRYYYDEDDRLTDFYSGSEVAQKTILTVSHNISEEVSAK